MNILHLAYSDPYGASDAAAAAIMAAVYGFGAIFGLIGYVIGAFLLMKVFEKAGVEGKWRAWVPGYNYLIYAKLGDVSPWVVLGVIVAAFIPILNIFAGLAFYVVMIMASVRVNAKFGKEWPILLLFILGPLGILIYLAILAFGSARWNPAAASPSPWGSSFLADKTVWSGIPVQPSQSVTGASAGGYAAPAPGYGQPQSPTYPSAGSTPPPPPASSTGTTPPPPSTGTTPPPPAPPAGPQV